MKNKKISVMLLLLALLSTGCDLAKNQTKQDIPDATKVTEEKTTECLTEEKSEEEIYIENIQKVLYGSYFYMPSIQNAGFSQYKFLEDGYVYEINCMDESMDFDDVQDTDIHKYKWYIDGKRELLVVEYEINKIEYEYAEELGGFVYDYDLDENNLSAPPSCYEFALIPLSSNVSETEVRDAYQPYMNYFGDNADDTEQASSEFSSEYNVQYDTGDRLWSDWSEKHFHSEDGMELIFFQDQEGISIFIYNDPIGHPMAHVVYIVRETEENNVVVGGITTLDPDVDTTWFGISKDEAGQIVIDVCDVDSDYHTYYREY